MPTLALGQSATPGTTIELEPIVIDGTSGALATAEERQRDTPGGTDLLRAETYRDKATVTLSDVLDGAPGVVVQDFFGGFDQPASRSAPRPRDRILSRWRSVPAGWSAAERSCRFLGVGPID